MHLSTILVNKRCVLLIALLLTLAVSARAASPVITTTSLGNGISGTSYSATFTATGGTTPYTWSVSAGALPSGLSLSSAGLLSGTPTAAGTFNFTVRVTDNASAVGTQAFALEIYLTAAANGIGIPFPTSTNYTTVTDAANTVQVPENMVYVPAGSFTYGSGSTASTVTLPGFCINRFEVTNAEYKAFLNATGSTNYPSYWSGGTYPAGRANHPLLFVSLTQANAYAAWVKGQTGWNVVVPTAYQWEKAARGPNAYLYPWGNTLDATYSGGVLTAKSNFNANVTSYYLNNFPNSPATYNNSNSTHYNQTVTVATIAGYSTANVPTYLSVSSSAAVSGYVDHTTYTGFIYTDVFSAINNSGGFTVPVGSYESGKCAYGAYDMAGNAYEWTTTLFVASNGAEAGQTVNEVRGGGWYSNGVSGQSIDTGEGRSGTGAYNSVGFRVAMLPPGYVGPVDHFTWDYVPASVNAGTHFAVALSARDATGTLVTGYNGTANLTAASGSTTLTVSPTTTAAFVNGTFLGYVTLASAANNVVLGASDGASHTGASAAITVGATLVSTAGDGIPDSWKTAHGFNPSANIAALDTDGDGMNNLAEYLAGTDPQSSASRLVITAVTSPVNGQFSVSWPGVAGKLYRIDTAADLAGTWTSLTPLSLATTTGTQTVTLATGGAAREFVRVEIAP